MTPLYLVILLLVRQTTANISISVHGSQQNGTTLLLECSIQSYASVASWIDYRTNSILAQCVSTGVCFDNGNGNYIYYSNLTGIYASINLSYPQENNKVWMCSYENFKSIYTVQVFDRPTITMVPNYNPYNVLENTTDLQLTCNITDANPSVAYYRWYRNGSQIFSSENATLSFSRVLRSDSGGYSCDASNIVGSSNVSSVVQLNIFYGISMHGINKQTSIEGDQLMITCNGLSNPIIQNNDVVWSKQNNNTFRLIGQQLTIKNVARKDSGTYICTVILQLTPSVGQSIKVTGTTSVDVDVLYRPTVTILPDNNPYDILENTTDIKFTCNVIDANPTVTTFRWYRNDIQIQNAYTENFTLSNVQKTDSGSYRCDGSNSVGVSNVSAVLQLNVLYGVLMNDIGKVQPQEGETLVLYCTGQSNPPIEDTDVIWSKQDNSTFRRMGQDLIIKNANKLDSGIFVCTVVKTLTPSYGLSINVTQTTSAEVDVLYAPLLDDDAFSSSAVIDVGIGMDLNITINILARPIPSIEWKFQNNGTSLQKTIDAVNTFTERKHTSRINILNIEGTDFGYYIFTARNVIGTIVRNITVRPGGKPNMPDAVFAMCDSSSATIIWKSQFNGGIDQEFFIYYQASDAASIESSSSISDPGENFYVNKTLYNLLPSKRYQFIVAAKNKFGESSSTTLSCTVNPDTTSQMVNNDKIVLNAGITLLVIGALLILTTVIVILINRLRLKKLNRNSSSRQYTDIGTTSPVLTYDTLTNKISRSDITEMSNNQKSSSMDAYEDIQGVASGKEETDYKSLPNHKKGGNKTKDRIYANMYI